eukprot:SAG11_NODE_3597_length_2347_cov_3.269573_4_plen_193_part_00
MPYEPVGSEGSGVLFDIIPGTDTTSRLLGFVMAASGLVLGFQLGKGIGYYKGKQAANQFDGGDDPSKGMPYGRRCLTGTPAAGAKPTVKSAFTAVLNVYKDGGSSAQLSVLLSPIIGFAVVLMVTAHTLWHRPPPTAVLRESSGDGILGPLAHIATEHPLLLAGVGLVCCGAVYDAAEDSRSINRSDKDDTS